MIIKYDLEKETRIDRFLSELNLQEIASRSYIEKLIVEKRILVNKKNIKKSYKLELNDIIEIDFPERPQASLDAENIPLEILYEDEYLAVVNKPINMVVHPATGNLSGTLLNAAMYHFNGKLSKLDSDRPGIVHRLDKNTTGVIVIAKEDKTHTLLQNMFKDKTIEKYYKAVVVGDVHLDSDTINEPIGRHKSDRLKKAINPTGRSAITHYSVNKRYGCFTIVDLRIETGRTHQIRVHMSHINNPILGDVTYNSLKRTLNRIPLQFHSQTKYLLSNILHRQALHAFRLKFNHPITNEIIDVESPLPEDFKNTINWLETNFIEE